MTDDFFYAPTKYGFIWGEAEVMRVASCDAFGVIIGVKAPCGEVIVRVTPKGTRIVVETLGNVTVKDNKAHCAPGGEG